MSPISKVLFDPAWIEQLVIKYFNAQKDLFESHSEFTKDRQRRAIGFYLIGEYCGMTLAQISERYPMGQATVWKQIQAGKAIQSEDKEELEKIIKAKSKLAIANV